MVEDFIKERVYLTGVSSRTVDWYRVSFRQFQDALSCKADVIERIKVLKERGVSHITINSYLRCINAYLKWSNAGFKIPRLKEEQKILMTLSVEACRALVSFKPAVERTNLRRAHLIALTILDTGLRASEVLSLTKQNINMENLVFNVIGKGGKHRLVPFSHELRKSLFRFGQKVNSSPNGITCYLFGTKNNTKVSVWNLNRDFKVLGQQLGITGVRFSPHTLRHTFATNWLRRGGDLFMLSRILGHSSINTTTIYLRSLGIDDLSKAHRSLSVLGGVPRYNL